MKLGVDWVEEIRIRIHHATAEQIERLLRIGQCLRLYTTDVGKLGGRRKGFGRRFTVDYHLNLLDQLDGIFMRLAFEIVFAQEGERALRGAWPAAGKKHQPLSERIVRR